MSFRTMRAKRTQRKEVGEYLRLVCDDGCFVEIESGLKSRDPLNFPGYGKKLEENRILTDEADSCVAGCGRIEGLGCVMAELSRNFMMGSMGTAAGEKLTMAFEEADRRALPLIIFSASGGARMQEGMFSLVQMARTSAAIRRFQDHGGLYISVLTHPTTGGVSASFAMLGDIILAEEHALIGFAGPRVIEQTIGEKLPEGFQRAEFQLEHGFVDRVVRPEEMKETILRILCLHKKRRVMPRPAKAEA
jgi:acetyl-CoA carboxylase carboxyl transferase subunit beta